MGNKGKDASINSAKMYPKGQAAKLQKMTKIIYLLLPIGIVSLLVFAFLVVTNAYFSAEQLESTKLLNQYRLASKTLTTTAQSYSILGEEVYLDKYNQELNVNQNREKALSGLSENNITSYEWEQIEKIAEMSEALAKLEEEAFLLIQDKKLTEAQRIMYGEEYLSQMEEINNLTDEMIQNVQDRIGKEQEVLLYCMLSVQVVFILIFILLVRRVLMATRFADKELLVPIVEVSKQMEALANGNFLQKLDLEESESEVGTMITSIQFMKDNFVRMINEISEALAEMSEGNYQIEIVEEYVGDFVAIKESLELIIEDTKKMLTTVVEASEEIEDGADKLAQAAVNLADGCTTQAQQITEIVDLIEEMTKDLEAGVASAKETVFIATEAGEALNIGNEKMTELKEAIAIIQGKDSQIKEVLTILKDMVNQTNVLALDAAIEAFRTGDNDKEFMVTVEQIKDISEEASKACESMLEMIITASEVVNRSLAIADFTSANMAEVMEGAKMATEQMSAMADGLALEEAKMRNMNQLVEEIAQVVDNNSATSEETAAISEVQAAQTQTMVQLIHRFKI